jgi:hypothetical protein
MYFQNIPSSPKYTYIHVYIIFVYTLSLSLFLSLSFSLSLFVSLSRYLSKEPVDWTYLEKEYLWTQTLDRELRNIVHDCV